MTALAKMADGLERPFHLLVWEKPKGFEVVAVRGEEWEDAFPLPVEVQEAAAAMEMILDTTTAARLEIGAMPEDFWEELEEVEYGSSLRVSLLGRPGRKYLEVFEAVRKEESGEGLSLQDEEVMKVARWIREAGIFDFRSGEVLMEVLAGIGK